MTWFATDFADQAVILPLYLCVTVGLWLLGRRRDAVVWLGVVGATLGLMLTLKIAARDCVAVSSALGVPNPSGHTASAAAAYGGLVALLVRGRLAAIAAAIVVAACIGATRILLGVHLTGEVLVGAVVGVLGALALAVLRARPSAPSPNPGPAARAGGPLLVALCAGIIIVFHGHRLAAEERIGRLAGHVWPFSLCLSADIEGGDAP